MVNNLKGLQKSIQSIEKQNFKDYEVLVIDGDSSQKTQAYLQTLQAPFFYQSSKDKGVYDAMNKGIQLSKGEWLFFLGSGDVFFNSASLTTIFETQIPENYNLIAGKVAYVGDENPFIYSKKKRVKNPSWSLLMWIRNGLHHQGTLYKKSLFSKRQYNLAYKVLGDYEFNLYLYKNNTSCFIVDATITICETKGLSKSGNWGIYKEEIQLKKTSSSLFLTPIFCIIAFAKYVLRKIIHG